MNIGKAKSAILEASYTSNYENMISRITANGVQTDFYYDADSKRVQKTQGTNTTLYFNETYEEINNTQTLYIFAGNLRIAKITGTDIKYYHKDHLGSTTALTDESGNTIDSGGYLPYGLDKEVNALLQNSSYKFTDQEQDNGTGLYNYDARLYDPTLGQFVMADTIVPDLFNPQSLNRYGYCLNNPLIYTDPSGHLPFGFLGTRRWGEDNPVGLQGANDFIKPLVGEPGLVMMVLSYVVPGLRDYGEWHDGLMDDLKINYDIDNTFIKVSTNIMCISSPFFAIKDLISDFFGLFSNNNITNTNIESPMPESEDDNSGNNWETYGDKYGRIDGHTEYLDLPDKGKDNPKVICVELYRQGLLDPVIFKADEAFGRYLYITNNNALKGYHLWAKPVVRIMQHSKTGTKIVFFFAKPWTEEMAYRMGVRDEGNFLGNLLMITGLPICELLGKFANCSPNFKYGFIMFFILFIFGIDCLTIEFKKRVKHQFAKGLL